MPEEVFVLIMVVFFTLVLPMTFILGVPASKALRRRIEGKAGELPPGIVEELDHLRERVEEVDHLRERVEELEERQDFADRLLARQSRESLPAPDPGAAGQL